VKKRIAIVVFVLLLAGFGFVSIKFYSFVFARKVRGEVMRVERVNTAEAIITSGGAVPSQIFSFAVAIRDEKGEIYTASSEDRQWSLIEKGQCVVAKIFPYPPWQLDKGNTYFGARLERIFECGSKD
jgi:hypothetical protein